MADCPQPAEVAPEFQRTGYSWAGVRALEQAIQTGVFLVRLNNRTTQFQSATQMMQVRDDMRATLNAEYEAANPSKRRPRLISYKVCR